jgi:hypothetical protein
MNPSIRRSIHVMPATMVITTANAMRYFTAGQRR